MIIVNCSCGKEVVTVPDDSDPRGAAVMVKSEYRGAEIGVVHRLGKDGVITFPLENVCLGRPDCEAKKRLRQLVSP